MSAIEDRERSVVIDLSQAASSADAVRQLEMVLERQHPSPFKVAGQLVDINTGNLLLTPGVLTKLKTVLKRFGVEVKTLYSAVPQTQQSALDEGLFVRQCPPAASQPFGGDSFSSTTLKNLDLPFESLPPAMPSRGESLSKLSITLDDGSREELHPTVADQSFETVFYKQNLRSGQVLEASGNIVIVGDAHSGSEILADGDILVWGVLGGIAHAGRAGYVKAEIRAVRIEAVQLRIAQYIARRPDRLFKAANKTNRALEVAKVRGEEIQIFEDTIC